ncbi:hypothetical protein CspeluHIS016_0504390 [Cutaneotrichosporon spelunceum]|uniref:MARVEL domain-containing protein n=1 Tax=Cutaneotrichosporon spelunceum TaxID=1672016 RepID=A0AAD3TXV1_9TREE|nr:hypothetical protein CspeluHIS016_0504390 [Cutaneotrichosporon spelunceum]
MASPVRVQIATYALLLFLLTFLATLLASSLTESAALSLETSNEASSLSLLIVGFAFALTTFAYLLMFLIQRQLHPGSKLVWLATDCVALTLLSIFGFGCAIAFTSRSLLDIGSCVSSTAGSCSLTVGAGALLWISSILLTVVLAYLLITKGVNHPGRNAWVRSLRSLTEREDINAGARTSIPHSNRSSTIIIDGGFSHSESLPFLNANVVARNETPQQSAPQRTRHSPPPPCWRSGSSLPYSHVKSSLPLSYSTTDIPYSENTAAHSQASLPNARSQTPFAQRQLPHLHSYSQSSLPVSSHSHCRRIPVHPLPPLIMDEKRRELSPTHCPSTTSATNLQIQIPPPHDGEESMFLSATSDALSVFADDAGSLRSRRSDFHEYPSMQLPAQLADSLVTGSQWNANNPPHPQYSRRASGPTVASPTPGMPAGKWCGPQPHARSDLHNLYASDQVTNASGQRLQENGATPYFNVRPSSQTQPLFIRTSHAGEEEATLFFNNQPHQPSADEATLFFNNPRAVTPALSQPSEDTTRTTVEFSEQPMPAPLVQDESGLSFNRKPFPQTPTANSDEATLSLSAPMIASPALAAGGRHCRKSPSGGPPRRSVSEDEATLFFSGP